MSSLKPQCTTLNILVIAGLFIAKLFIIDPGTASEARAGESTIIVEASESLEWLRAQQHYIAQGNAVVTTPNFVIRADRIEAHYIETDDAQGSNNIITHVKGEGNTPTIIHANGTLKAKGAIIYKRDKRLITASDNVSLVMANGRQVFGDYIAVQLNTDETAIIDIVIEGHSRFISPKGEVIRETTADNAYYLAAENSLTLTGNIHIVDDTNTLTGDHAVINTVTGSSVITSNSESSRVTGSFTLKTVN